MHTIVWASVLESAFIFRDKELGLVSETKLEDARVHPEHQGVRIGNGALDEGQGLLVSIYDWQN